EDVVGMDSAILMHPKVWEASGHVAQFHDLMVENKLTNKRYRLDQLLEGQAQPQVDQLAKDLGYPSEDGDSLVHVVIPRILHAIVKENKTVDLSKYEFLDDANRKKKGAADWAIPRQFNLMFKTHVGPTEDEAAATYLRPETAQGIFVNFLNVQAAARAKLPFGIAQMGKAFRNEITTGNFLFRTREFEQMELEFFVRPEHTTKWLEYWADLRLNWYLELGVTPGKLRLRPHGKDELAHYSKACYDVEYQFPFMQQEDGGEGWGELEGIADRGTYDLSQHQEFSGKKLAFFDPELNRSVLPAVVEASAGVDRTVLTLLTDAYHEEEAPKAGGEGTEPRVVLRLAPALAPITVAVFPLVNKDGMPEIARKLADDLRGDLAAFYDAGGSIGRRYRRQDEAGTPFCVTIDGQTSEDQTVTVRDRDTLKQERVALERVEGYVRERML
ncbi:MAG: glycine--tRNA ligase, partial [Candidatus Neomarinimicrobiota bacterium]